MTNPRKRVVRLPLVYDGTEPKHENPKPKRRDDLNLMPVNFHVYDHSDMETLRTVTQKARLLDLDSNELLNLIIILHRSNFINERDSLLNFLENLR